MTRGDGSPSSSSPLPPPLHLISQDSAIGIYLTAEQYQIDLDESYGRGWVDGMLLATTVHWILMGVIAWMVMRS